MATAVAVGPVERVFVADFFNHRIRIFSGEGIFLNEFGTHDTGEGQFDRPADVGYQKHYRVCHGSNPAVLRGDNNHIIGIESFRSFAKRRLAKFNGISVQTFYLHLKECEWRFNHRRGNRYKALLKLLRDQPL